MTQLKIVSNTNADQTYRQLLSDLDHEPNVSPRGMPVYESIAHRVVIDMEEPVVTSMARKLHLPFLFAEAAWMLEGRADVEWIAPYNRHLSRFSDDGDVFFGAYGPKIEAQFSGVVQALLQDKDTRQAVLTIWRENPPPTKDVPCTVSLQFMIRNGKMHCISNMRSNDAWLGFPYDIFNFSMVAWAVALEYNQHGFEPISIGKLFHSVASMHRYEQNAVAARDVVLNATAFKSVSMPDFHQINNKHMLTELLKGLAEGHLYAKR